MNSSKPGPVIQGNTGCAGLQLLTTPTGRFKGYRDTVVLEPQLSRAMTLNRRRLGPFGPEPRVAGARHRGRRHSLVEAAPELLYELRALVRDGG